MQPVQEKQSSHYADNSENCSHCNVLFIFSTAKVISKVTGHYKAILKFTIVVKFSEHINM